MWCGVHGCLGCPSHYINLGFDILGYQFLSGNVEILRFSYTLEMSTCPTAGARCCSPFCMGVKMWFLSHSQHGLQVDGAFGCPIFLHDRFDCFVIMMTP